MLSKKHSQLQLVAVMTKVSVYLVYLVNWSFVWDSNNDKSQSVYS